jgi:hypothetical protein
MPGGIKVYINNRGAPVSLALAAVDAAKTSVFLQFFTGMAITSGPKRSV